MKKILATLLVILIIPFSALAEPITIDLSSASIEELQSARNAINARISEIQIESSPKIDEKFIIEGIGTQILDPISVSSPLSRFVVTSDSKFNITFDSLNSRSNGKCYVNYIDSSCDVSQVMIETQGEWSIDCSPIVETESPYTSGTGAYITDYFKVSTPKIVTITVECDGRYGGVGLSVTLYGIDKNGNVHIIDFPIQGEHISGVETFDVIIKQGYFDEEYFFFEFDCASNAKWSITEK